MRTIGREEFEIFKAVVVSLAVLVMHNLTGKQIPTEMGFHHETMFEDVGSLQVGTGMIRRIDKNVPL